MASQGPDLNGQYPIPYHGNEGGGLEVVPQAANGPERYYGPAWEHYGQKPPLSTTTATEVPPHYTGSPISEAAPERKRILGLTVKTFWILVFVIVVILAAGIGGGVAGGLAASNKNNNQEVGVAPDPAPDNVNDNVRENPEVGDGNTASPSPSPSQSTTPTSTSVLTQQTGQVLPAAIDDCPRINNTIIQPLNATGGPWGTAVGNPTVQKFRVFCDLNMSSDIRKGLIDIMFFPVRNLEECIGACAGYNYQYNNNAQFGAGRASTGLCKAVTLHKKAGFYCTLKNGTRFDFSAPEPQFFTSAVLVA
ncbi:hypothetical protein QBC35DRAFT_531734 [Podospora australis]|uniref:Apple domain-containing protein n=1 Tax=Podospora australis TaxID=1536484 RepID=A0AAN6WU89_9PEZI|nr:hypothetical protein QBC35DRAFT_531734 [Podospora australis]